MSIQYTSSFSLLRGIKTKAVNSKTAPQNSSHKRVQFESCYTIKYLPKSDLFPYTLRDGDIEPAFSPSKKTKKGILKKE